MSGKKPADAPVVEEDGWRERYGCYSKAYGNTFRLSFARASASTAAPGYELRINDSTLKRRPESSEQAKRYILATAINWAESALARMKEDFVKAYGEQPPTPPEKT